MKNIMDKIERVHYTSFTYNTIDEKNHHITDMQQKGYECLENFEDEKQATYRRFLED